MCERWHPLGQRRGIAEEIATAGGMPSKRSSQRRTRTHASTQKRRTCTDGGVVGVLRGLSVDDEIEEAIAARRLPGSSRQLPKQLCRQGESKSEEMSWDGSEGENDERRELGGMAGHRWRW